MEDWEGWAQLDTLQPSMQSQVDAFTQARKAAEQAEVQRVKEQTRQAFDAACTIIHYRPTAAPSKPSSTPHPTPDGEEEEEDEAALPTPSPSEPEIDVSTLRHVIDRLVDATDRMPLYPRGALANGDASHTPNTSPLPLTPTSTSTVLHLLQTVLSHKHDWLDKAKSALTAISRGRDSGVTLGALQSLLEEAEAAVPLMTSKEKKRVERVVERCKEWRARWRGLYEQVRRGERVPAESRMKLADLARVVKEYDKNCGSVVMEEVSWYRAVLDLAKRLIAQFNERVRREEKEEDDADGEDEVLERRETRAEKERERDTNHRDKASDKGEVQRVVVKFTIAEAQALLSRMQAQLPFLELMETSLLSSHIAAAAEWLSSATDAISAVDPASPTSVSHCRTLLDSADSLALAVPTNHLHSLLETRVWSHRADSLFSTSSASGERGPPPRCPPPPPPRGRRAVHHRLQPPPPLHQSAGARGR